MNHLLKRLFSSRIMKYLREMRDDLMDRYAIKSYSQEGEDMILRRIFEENKRGFYVDVGAHHPTRFSNTYYFYKKGWRGINIDAMPGSMDLFKKRRPRDINIERAVSDRKDVLTYHVFNETALNSFSKDLVKNRDKHRDYKVILEYEIETTTLEEILDQYMPKGEIINFLSIDVEGLDVAVLKSNNWNKYIPEVILIEILGSSLDELANDEITRFLRKFGYSIYAKCVNTLIFKKN